MKPSARRPSPAATDATRPGTGAWPCLQLRGDHCELLVQVVPNASRSACAGFHDGALRVRLAAPPIEGRANAALVEWLAAELGLSRRQVQLISGDTSRRKRLAVDGDAELVKSWLARVAGPIGA